MLRPRLRTFTLWTGTLLCGLIVAGFVVSGWWSLMLQLGGVAVYVMAGSVTVLIDDPFNYPVLVDWHSHGLSRWATFARADFLTTWVEFPLLAATLAVTIPTLLIWRFWPKPPKPGHCRCGYDLHGNTSGRCPECGEPAEPKGDAA